jgi:hypothetical protein
MKGVALLAAALGWDLVQRPKQPAQLVSPDGQRRNMPTDTGVRQSVFWSLIASIIGHSADAHKLPSADLVDRIVKESGMSAAHAQALKAKVDRLASIGKSEPEEEAEETVEEEKVLNPLDLPRLEGEPPEPFTEFVPIERTEPTVNHAGDGGQYISEIMDTIIRQLAADGDEQITYRCKVCGLEFETKRGCGAHYQRHVQAGEAEATAGNKRVIINKIPDYVPTEIHTPRVEGLSVELRRLRKIVKDVQLAVGQDALKEYEQRAYAQQRKIEALTKERDDAIARADRLASDLRSLRELIHGISDE